MEARVSDAEERFEAMRKSVGLWLGPLVALIIYFLPPFWGLKEPAQHLAAVLAFAMIYWMCEPIPLPATALVAPALCVVLGIAEAKALLANFADPVVFLFIGSFLLAEAMSVHKLDSRVALTLLSLPLVGNSPRRLIFAFGAIAAFISLWLSNTATTAMMLPIALGVLNEVRNLMRKASPEIAAGFEGSRDERNLSRALLLTLAYSASAGGIGTPIGTPPNIIGLGFIRTLLERDFTFFQWMAFAVPLLAVMFLLLFVLMLVLFPLRVKALPGLGEYLHDRRKTLGPWTLGQGYALLAFGIAVALWVAPGAIALFAKGGDQSALYKSYQKLMPEGIAALLAACLLFFLPTHWREKKFALSWNDATRIDWGTILLFGGGIALGSLSFSTGLAEALGRQILTGTGVTSLAGITLITIVMAVFVSEATSNTASANMVIPVAIAVAQGANVDPLLPALGACLGSSWGFMLPVSTPPNAIVYGTGKIPIPSMLRAGILFDIAGIFIIWGGLLLIQPTASALPKKSPPAAVVAPAAAPAPAPATR